ncbi:sensor domain-containing diguanylate cyclase [Vibrio atypicus]|uniref:sensor domain-containing diguanylate cyclase n=1 Tax=Vibrio atypicus TaxID=558271 RepID=UPI0037360275
MAKLSPRSTFIKLKAISFAWLLLIVSVPSLAWADLETLRVANSKAWKPFSYLNDQNEPAGILIDFWREYGKANDVHIEFVLLDWNDSLLAVKEGKADVHAGLMWSESRDLFLDYGDALFRIEAQLYYSQLALGTDIDLLLNGDLDQAIGVVKGGYEEMYVRSEYPNAQLKLYDNNQLLIEGAFSAEIIAFAADLHVANFYLYSSSTPNSFVPIKFLYSGEIFPAVAEGEAELVSRITKGFKQVDESEKNKILNKWMHIETVYPDFLAPMVIGAVALVTLLYIVLLRGTVKARTAELETANHKLTKLSMTDELTQIHNRRYFMDQLDKISTEDRPVAVMVFDIDDFKVINDTWGHGVGDDVIKSVAEQAKNSLGPDIVMARIGGEEFALIAFELDYCEAHDQAESICAAVNELQLDNDLHTKVSVSLGCAYYQSPDSRIDLSVADRLMYEAKTWGKNRAVSERAD